MVKSLYFCDMKHKNKGVVVLIFSLIAVYAGISNLCSQEKRRVTLGEKNSYEQTEQKSILSGIFSEDSSGGESPVEIDASKLLYVKTPNQKNSQQLSYTGFNLSFNRDNHTPDWVAWELLGSETQGGEKRSSRFKRDNRIKSCPDPADYKRSGYDKGHMCPAADQKWSEEAMSDCFYMTNIVPQSNALNSKAWQTLEKLSRVWAQRDSAIIIVCGPIYTSDDQERIGRTGVRVPSAFYKAILAPYLHEPRAIAFVYPNMSVPGNIEQYVMTIDDLEKITGYDFFSALPNNVETEVESKTSFTKWNRK